MHNASFGFASRKSQVQLLAPLLNKPPGPGLGKACGRQPILDEVGTVAGLHRDPLPVFLYDSLRSASELSNTAAVWGLSSWASGILCSWAISSAGSVAHLSGSLLLKACCLQLLSASALLISFRSGRGFHCSFVLLCKQ